MSNSLGKMFVVTTFGESHGKCVGAVIDGCPAGLPIDPAEIQNQVDRRRPELGAGGTSRREEDRVEVLSGIFNQFTTGAPICLMIWNRDVDSSYYESLRLTPRPGHADCTAHVKYGGFNDYRGGGRFSGRMTASYVMAGAVARKLLKSIGIDIAAHTVQIGSIRATPRDFEEIKEDAVKNAVRCADPKAAATMLELIEKVRTEGDSLGGTVEGVAINLPVGVGEPIFDTLEGELGKALFAIPAVKGVEFGSGFAAAGKRGSENNDPFVMRNGKVVTLTNNSGGILGGISNGMPLVVRVAFKPTPSIAGAQQTVNIETGEETSIKIKGRHDTCIVPRAVAVVEAVMAIVISDLALRAGVISRVLR